MKDQDIALFFTCGSVVCIIMAIVNVMRYKSRGLSAYFLAAAFVSLGFLFIALLQKWPRFVMAILGVMIAVSLVGDFIIRSANRKDLG